MRQPAQRRLQSRGCADQSAIAAAVHAEMLTIADGTHIIVRVAEFRSYLLKAFGKPSIDNAKPFDDAFRGKQGIIAFTVSWRDASGHIALLRHGGYREPDHDNYALFDNGAAHTSKGAFWELA